MPTLSVILKGDGRSFAGFLNQAQSHARIAGKNIKDFLGSQVAGGFAAFGSALTAKKFLSDIDKLADKAKEIKIGSSRLDVDTQRFQDLAYAAKKANSEISAVYTAFRKIAVGSVDARDGNLEMQAAFGTLGVTLDDLASKSPDQIFHKIGLSLRGAHLSATQLSAVIKTMGRGADELVPGMKAGLFDRQDPFGMSKEDVEKSTRFKSNLNFWKGFSGLMWREIIKPREGTGTDGSLINSAFGWVTKKFKKTVGYSDTELADPLKPTQVSAAELKAEEERIKDAEEERLKRVKQINELSQKLIDQEREAALEKLTTEEKILELKRRQAEQSIIESESNDEIEKMKARIESGEIAAQIGKLEDKKGTVLGNSGNELQKIGAFSANVEASRLEESIRVQRQVAINTDYMNRTIKTMSQNIKDIFQMTHHDRVMARAAGDNVRF